MQSKLKIIRINPIQPEADKIALAARVISEGGVIGYPTDTIYGLGCNAFNPAAVERIFTLKGREHGKPVILIIHTQAQLGALAASVPESARRLMAHFWPGPLTLVFAAHPDLKQLWPGSERTLAIRIPSSAICLALLAQCRVPLVSTSANRSGTAGATTAREVRAAFPDNLDLLIDGGPGRSPLPSTVIDCSSKFLRLIRAGAIRIEAIEAVVGAIACEKIDGY